MTFDGQATGERDYVDRVEGNNTLGDGTGGANRKYQEAVAAVIATFDIDTATAEAALTIGLEQLAAVRAATEAHSYADYLALYAQSNPTPWLLHAAALADAAALAESQSAIAADQLTPTIVAAWAKRDYAIAQAGAVKTESNVAALAESVRAFAEAAAGVEKAGGELTAIEQWGVSGRANRVRQPRDAVRRSVVTAGSMHHGGA